jgi:hypothetical protein
MAFVIALAGGVSLAALAGARRTDSAIGRFVTYFGPAQGQIEAPSSDFVAISRLPEVAATEAGAFMLLEPLDREARVDHSYEVSTVAVLDHLDFSRPLVVAGRLPRANQMNEVVVNPSACATRPGVASSELMGHSRVSTAERGFQSRWVIRTRRKDILAPRPGARESYGSWLGMPWANAMRRPLASRSSSREHRTSSKTAFIGTDPAMLLELECG